MKLSEELKWRGFWNQTTFKDPEILDKEKTNNLSWRRPFCRQSSYWPLKRLYDGPSLS